MADENEMLERFVNAVNADADEKIEDIGIEADKEKLRILGEAEQAAHEAADKFTAEKSVKGSGCMKEVSSAELEMKKTVLRRREELIGKVFENTAVKLAEFRSSKGYAAYLAKAAASAAVQGSTVHLAPEDMKYEKDIRRIIGNFDITFISDRDIRLGGLSVFRPDTSTSADLTFDTALDEQRSIFAASDPFGLNK